MNLTNLNTLIAIVERAKGKNSFYMPNHQSTNHYRLIVREEIPKTEQEFYARKFKADLLGHVALAPEWRDQGGGIDLMGMPQMPGVEEGRNVMYPAVQAMENWLKLTNPTVAAIFYGYEIDFGDECKRIDKKTYTYSSKPWNKLTAEDILTVLYELRSNGEIAFLERIARELPAYPTQQKTLLNVCVRRFVAMVRALKRMPNV